MIPENIYLDTYHLAVRKMSPDHINSLLWDTLQIRR